MKVDTETNGNVCGLLIEDVPEQFEYNENWKLRFDRFVYHIKDFYNLHSRLSNFRSKLLVSFQFLQLQNSRLLSWKQLCDVIFMTEVSNYITIVYLRLHFDCLETKSCLERGSGGTVPL